MKRIAILALEAAALSCVIGVLLSSGSARAFSVTQSGAGGIYEVGDTITLTYSLENIGLDGIAIFAFKVEFDELLLTFDQGASFASRWILTGSQNEGTNPVSPNYQGLSRTRPDHPIELDPGLVYWSWENSFAPSWTESSSVPLGTLVFQATVPGVASIAPIIGTLGSGSTAFVYSGTYANPGAPNEGEDLIGLLQFSGGGSVTVIPEPSTALLIGLGVCGLAALGQRD